MGNRICRLIPRALWGFLRERQAKNVGLQSGQIEPLEPKDALCSETRAITIFLFFHQTKFAFEVSRRYFIKNLALVRFRSNSELHTFQKTKQKFPLKKCKKKFLIFFSSNLFKHILI